MNQRIQLTAQINHISWKSVKADEKGNELSQSIITSQRIIHSLHILKFDISQSAGIPTLLLLLYCSLPLSSQSLIIPCAESNAPPFENNYLDFILTLSIDNLPLRFINSIALSAERRLVILWNRSFFALPKRSKDLFS